MSMSETVYASIRVSARHYRTVKEQCFWLHRFDTAERCLEILPPARLSFRPRKLISLFPWRLFSPIFSTIGSDFLKVRSPSTRELRRQFTPVDRLRAFFGAAGSSA